VSELAQVLRRLPVLTDPALKKALLVGTETRDDAAVVRLGKHGLVLTADFFAPVVDDPYDYGRIAAANALSDVYAMGGKPLVAINLLAFPPNVLSGAAVGRILKGGADTVLAAGAMIAGGHTIDDPEPKYGLAVVGLVPPDKIWRNVGAKPGDALLLTKPIGTGIVTTAIKRGLASAKDIKAATKVMVTLNDRAAAALSTVQKHVHAVTDVTGFGLLGHLLEMLDGSKVGARLSAQAIPVLPAARRLAQEDVFPGGTRSNLAATKRQVKFTGALAGDERLHLLLADAQTSGGLLAAIAEPGLARARAALEKRGVEAHVIGRIVRGRALITVDP
jgi:selenide,water dikinase